jgi:dihydrofolate synthase/folylpolyglutamate synthase
MQLGDALAWLDSHQNLERMLADHRTVVPDLGRMRRLMDLMGNPERVSPVIHVTGTNGKTSTARSITALLAARGLRVGTFTSPHLERINERITANGEPINDDDLSEVLASIALLEPLLPEGDSLTWFEILTAAAFRRFTEQPADLAVLEVGLGGLWDATNVADGEVAVVTNIGLDHLEFLGPGLADVAAEKAGIIKAGSTVVLGETRPELAAIFEARPSRAVWRRDADFGCGRNEPAVGGRIVDLRTPGALYAEVFLDLHGAHQGDNFACALAACEAFFDEPFDEAVVRQAARTVSSPGRLEIVGRHPLCILDGAKNLDGARTVAAAIDEEFPDSAARILVVGMLRGKDAGEMLEAFGARRASLVVACTPPSPRAQPASAVAQAARMLGCPAEAVPNVSEAVIRAKEAAAPDDLVLVTGSLYVVGAARAGMAVGRP